MTAQLRKLSIAISALVLTIACGGSESGSPSGPSPAGPGSGSAGATVSGTVLGPGGSAAVRTHGAGLGGVKVSVEGTDLSATTNANGDFSLRGVPPGLVRLLFQGAGATGSVELNDVAQSQSISISVVVNGPNVEVESEARVTGSEAQLEGKIASVDYAGRKLVVGTTAVIVPQGVEITNGYRLLELTDLIVGARIHVKGTKSGDTITASRILAQQTGLDTITLSGVVSDTAGACPDATFRFGSTAIAVNRSTLFVQGSCALIKSGVTLEVKGLRRPDGSVLATQVKFNKNGDGDDDEDEGVPVQFSGVISGLSGPCPARKFIAGGRDVQTTGSTTFLTPCATLANGMTVAIKGKQTGSDKVIADEVK
jgi:hypothetical protein